MVRTVYGMQSAAFLSKLDPAGHWACHHAVMACIYCFTVFVCCMHTCHQGTESPMRAVGHSLLDWGALAAILAATVYRN
jgi:hypothetical protein